MLSRAGRNSAFCSAPREARDGRRGRSAVVDRNAKRGKGHREIRGRDARTCDKRVVRCMRRQSSSTGRRRGAERIPSPRSEAPGERLASGGRGPLHACRVVPRRDRERVDPNRDFVGDPRPQPGGQRRITSGEIPCDETLEQISCGLGIERSNSPPSNASIGRSVGCDLEGTLGRFPQTLRDNRVALRAAPQGRPIEEEPQRLNQRPRRTLGRQPQGDHCGIEETFDSGEVPRARSDLDAHR